MPPNILLSKIILKEINQLNKLYLFMSTKIVTVVSVQFLSLYKNYLKEAIYYYFYKGYNSYVI